jgi:hypothetical protein
LTLRLMPVFKMRLGPYHRVLLLMGRVHIHHLNLTLRMVNCPLIISLGIRHNFLRAVWSLLSPFQIPRVDDLLLVSRQHLCRMGRVWAGDRAAKASLIVIVHLFL